MNRYQQELAEMDRRHRLKVRAISFAISCGLIFAAAWSAGFSPTVALQSIHAWLAGETPSESAPPSPTPSSYIAQESEVVQSSEPVDLLSATAASVSGTTQRLHLVATTPGRNSAEGTAKIGTDPRAPQTYAAGAILLNGARLSEIHASYVVLTRDTETFRLDLRGNPNETPVSELAYVGGPSEVNEAELAVDHLSAILRMSPVFENDLLVGLQLYPGTKSSVFHQLGLQTGDVVLAIDGSPIFDAASATQLFEPLVNGTAMTLSVRRNAQMETISLDGSIVTRTSAEAGVYASQSPASLPSG